MAFTSVATLKAYIGIPSADTSRDVYLAALVDFANAELCAFFGLTTDAPTTYVDRIDVADSVDVETWQLWTRRYPVISITSVAEGSATLTSGTDYSLALDFGLVKRLGDLSAWSLGREEVVVTYVAGFATVPGDLAHAAALIAVQAYNTAARSGLRSETIGQYKYELGGASVAGGAGGGGGFGIPPEAERVLAKWRRPFVATPN